MHAEFCTGRRAALWAGVALAAVGAAGTAQASGYALLEQSAEFQGASYAGSAARADDPSTLFYNPAGMTQLPGYQFSISGALILPQSNLHSGRATTAAGTPASGTVGIDAGENVLLPSFYATAEIAPDWHLGLGVTSPFGLGTKYDPASIARYDALTTSLITTDITPSLAWQPLPVLSVAAGVRVEIANARLSQAVDFGSAGYRYRVPGYLPGQNDGISAMKGGDAAVGWQLGLLLQPVPGTTVGFDYRSPIFHKLSGSIAFQNAGPLAPLFPGGNASARLVTPDTFSLSATQDLGPFTLLAGIDYTLWSRFKDLQINYTGGPATITENWHDTVMLSAGADWHVLPGLTLRSGAAFDRTPASDSNRNALIPDANRYWLSVGATYKPLPVLALSAAYSHLFVDNSKVNTTTISHSLFQASYNSQIDILSLEATLSF